MGRVVNHGSYLLILLVVASTLTAQVAPSGAEYRIGPRDLLEIRVLEDSSLNDQQRVTEQGRIELPHVGAISVEGLTLEEAESRLQAALERYLQRASVSLVVKEYRFRPISVLGAVRTPGYLPFSGRWTLLEAMAEAGGVTDSTGNRIIVLRRAENGLTDRIEIDLKGLLYEADPTLNIPIFPNDIVNIPAAFDVTVNCIGEVNNPGPIRFRSTEQITLLAALGRAGGLTDRASRTVVVRRSDGSESVVRYKALLEGREPDLALREGDVIVVRESFF